MNTRTIQRIIDKYDGDNDVGMITWQDQALAEELVDTIHQVEIQRDRIAELEAKVDSLSEVIDRLAVLAERSR